MLVEQLYLTNIVAQGPQHRSGVDPAKATPIECRRRCRLNQHLVLARRMVRLWKSRSGDCSRRLRLLAVGGLPPRSRGVTASVNRPQKLLDERAVPGLVSRARPRLARLRATTLGGPCRSTNAALRVNMYVGRGGSILAGVPREVRAMNASQLPRRLTISGGTILMFHLALLRLSVSSTTSTAMAAAVCSAMAIGALAAYPIGLYGSKSSRNHDTASRAWALVCVASCAAVGAAVLHYTRADILGPGGMAPPIGVGIILLASSIAIVAGWSAISSRRGRDPARRVRDYPDPPRRRA